MRRIINYESIGETASYILAQKTLLEDLKSDLLKNIETISNGFRGKDSNVIKVKYTSKVKYVDEYLNVVGNYQKYFEWLAGKYKDRDDTLVKNLSARVVEEEPQVIEPEDDIIGFAKSDEVSDKWKI